MENATTPHPATAAVRTAIAETVGSVRAAAIQSGIPYTTLDRRLRNPDTFTVAELNRLAAVTDRTPSDFLGVA